VYLSQIVAASEEKIPNRRARYVDIRPQVLQRAISDYVILANSLLAQFDLIHGRDCAETKDSHEEQQPSESGKQEYFGLAMRRALSQVQV
jgi:hypothetical protein